MRVLQAAMSVRRTPIILPRRTTCAFEFGILFVHWRMLFFLFNVSAYDAFVASNEPVRRQCDSYLEVSSIDYVVASNERVHLQCELMFRGE